MTKSLKLNKIFKRILKINKNKLLNQMSNRLFNQAHSNKLFSQMSLRIMDTQIKIRLNKTIKLQNTILKFYQI